MPKVREAPRAAGIVKRVAPLIRGPLGSADGLDMVAMACAMYLLSRYRRYSRWRFWAGTGKSGFTRHEAALAFASCDLDTVTGTLAFQRFCRRARG